MTGGRECINHSHGVLGIMTYSCAIDTGVSLFKVMEYTLNLSFEIVSTHRRCSSWFNLVPYLRVVINTFPSFRRAVPEFTVQFSWLKCFLVLRTFLSTCEMLPKLGARVCSLVNRLTN